MRSNRSRAWPHLLVSRASKAAALGAGSEEARLEIAEKEEAGEPVTAEDKLNEAIAAWAHQDNLSFFAFTATPKPRTVELFGTPVPGADRKAPFHTYSMRQAIEEGFILDVLRHYTPFGVYWRVNQLGPGDPEVDKSKASAQIAKAISLHPHNLAQRAKIVVDHFRQHVAQQIGGQAKAMVVTASRLHAVRYKQSIDRYLADAHITDVKALVAFSGRVIEPDDPNVSYTEAGMNGIAESQTAARFKGEPSPPYDSSEVQEQFRSDLDAYIRAYSFLSQIVAWIDDDLEKLYVWAKSLQSNLPKRPNDGGLDLGAEVELTHLRIEKAAEVDASLAGTQVEEEPLSALPGAGGTAPDPQTERLSAITERLNERHALNLTITDALLFEQFKGDGSPIRSWRRRRRRTPSTTSSSCSPRSSSAPCSRAWTPTPRSSRPSTTIGASPTTSRPATAARSIWHSATLTTDNRILLYAL